MNKEPPDPPVPPDINQSPELFTMEVLTPQDSTKKLKRLNDSPAEAANVRDCTKRTATDPLSTPATQIVYTHSKLTNGIKQYSDMDKGPFLVHVTVEETSPDSGTILSPIKFGKFLYNNQVKNIKKDGVKKIGRNRVSVEFKTFIDANSFLGNPILQASKYLATIPTYNITRMGLVREVPTEFSMEEFVESLELPQECGMVLKARRMNRKRIIEHVPTWTPTQSVVLTFEGQYLPKNVYCYHTSLRVEPYTLPTIQCLACCRFGHVKAQCRSKPRCFKCCQSHLGESCTVTDDRISCLYCSGRHMATEKNCPEYQRQISIKVVMSKDNLSYQEASSQHPPVRRSYAEVARELFSPPSHSHSFPHSTQETHSSNYSTPTTSYKKTITRTPRTHMPLTAGYDRKAHQAIIAQEKLSTPNGCALSNNNKDVSPNDNLLDNLLSTLISLVSKYNDCIPDHVAKKLNIISNLIDNNGSGDPMECQ